MTRLATGVAAVVIATAGVSAGALAQSAQSSGPISFADIFSQDSAALHPVGVRRLADAASRASALGSCPMGRLTIYAAAGDPLFQKALASARRDTLLLALDRMGVQVDRFFADIVWTEPNRDDVTLEYDVARDEEHPSLKLKWVPDPGTKVKAGHRITAEAWARDDANLWQTGIKSIDMIVLPEENNSFFGFHDWPQPPLNCEDIPPARALDGNYTVPSPAPPVVRLRVLAVDFTPLGTFEDAEYPTSDWYGSIDFAVSLANGKHWGRYDIALDYDGQGNLTGRMEGLRHWDKQTSASQLSANLIGQYTPSRNALSLHIVDPKQTAGTFNGSHPWGGDLFWVQPVQQQLRNLRVAGDGSVQSTIDVWGEKWNLKLRRAQN